MEGAAREGWAGVGIVLYLREVVLTRIYVCIKTHRLSLKKWLLL